MAKEKEIRSRIKKEGKAGYDKMADRLEIRCETCCLRPSEGVCSMSEHGGPCESWDPTYEAFCAAFAMEGSEVKPLGESPASEEE